MGEVHVDITVTNVRTRERTGQITALVDTGSTLSVIPRAMLESLGILSVGPVEGVLADGREVTRDVAEAIVTVNDRSTPCHVVVGDADDTVVVGVTVLEQLGLVVDPVGGRLAPRRLLF